MQNTMQGRRRSALKYLWRPACGLALALAAASCARSAAAQPVPVRVEKKGAGFALTRGGQPYFIKGAGGEGPKDQLRGLGANSFRTWGAEGSQARLDEAQKHGMTMTLGIWLGHKGHGFNYADPAQVATQFESAKKTIDAFKNHPALLMWGIGNEMEVGQDADPNVWKAVEQIAAYAKQVDPNHPTMTVVAEIGGGKVEAINKFCPSIDVIGINTYAGGVSIPERYKAAGGTKPYVLTEFGPPGQWEAAKTGWNAPRELSSTDKAARYRATYERAVANQPLSLGSYAFTWGNKQEATATWFGMLLPDGTHVAAADTMAELWSGKPPANRVPAIRSLKLEGEEKVAPGSTVRVSLDAFDPEGDPLKVDWILQGDLVLAASGGAVEAVPPTYPASIVKADARGAEFKMPAVGGAYRAFAFLRDGKGGAAVANVPLFVEGGEKAPPAAARKAALPFTVYGEAGAAEAYAPSGFMGNAQAIKMDPAHEGKPHSGKTCLKVEYSARDNWGGVVWQSPANDWGDAPGGFDLSGAKRLSFWARGEKGGEMVNFVMGVLGKDKAFPDSGSAKLDNQQLSTEWRQYFIDVSKLDLSRIKTAFGWSGAATGEPFTFHLDDIRYE